MDRERLDKWCEWGVFGLVLAMLAFAPIAMGAVTTTPFLTLQAMACGILLLWTVRLWASSKFRMLWPPLCWPALAFVAYAAVRYHYSEIEYVARLELIKVVVYAVVFFAILGNLNRQEFALALCVTVIIVASLSSVYAIYQFAIHSRTVWGYERPPNYEWRVSGTFVNPNHLTGFIGMCLPAAIALVVASRLGHAYKIVLVYLSGVMLIAACLTLSRGGLVAVALSITILLLILVRRRNYRLPAACLLLILFSGGYYLATHSESLDKRVKDLHRGGQLTEVRADIWGSAWRMWRDNPWFGVGPGHFDFHFGQYRSKILLGRPRYAHNDYLNTLADWGATGGILVAATLALFFIGVAQTLPRVHRAGNDLQAKKSNRPAIVLGGAIAILAVLIHSVTEFNMQIPSNALLAVAWLALVSTYLRFATEKYWLSLSWPGKTIATALLLTVFAGLVSQGTTRAKAAYWARRAEKLPAGPERVPLLKKSFTIEPSNADTLYTLATNNWDVIGYGLPGYQEASKEALSALETAMRLNPWEEDYFLAYGKCLDWAGQAEKATPYFDHALTLDPNNYYVVAQRGWHATYLGDFRQAREWYGRSLALDSWRDSLRTQMYNDILPRRIKEQEDATNSLRNDAPIPRK